MRGLSFIFTLLFCNFFLAQHDSLYQVISEIKVSANVNLPFLSHEEFHVEDFLIVNDSTLITHVNSKSVFEESRIALFINQKHKFDTLFKSKSLNLVKNYQNSYYVELDNDTFLIEILDEKIFFSKPRINNYSFKKSIIDSLNNQLVYTDYKWYYPAFNYIRNIDSQNFLLCSIVDDFMMELYRSEYKYMDVRTKLWAREQEQSSGIDKEIWIGANVFTKSLYYKEVYSPLFIKNDSIFVFDFVHNEVKVYNALGDLLSSFKRDYTTKKNYKVIKPALYQDAITKEIYLIREKNSFKHVYKLNTINFTEKYLYKIDKPYIDKIKFYNNQMFFIFRPYESIQKKSIYKINF